MLDRIAKKTGLSFVYEPNDDGASVGADGASGVRGDLRIAGGPLTGALGYNGNASAVAASGGNSNGPQFHDLIQLHRKYGDPYEKPARNETRANATDLGSFGFWSAKTVGSDWDDIWIGADETGFTTASASNDADFFKLDTTGPMVVRARLTPKGPVYDYATEGQSAATVDAPKFMNLRLDAQDSSGGTLAGAGTGADLLEANGLILSATPARPLVIAVVPKQLSNFQNASRAFVIARGRSTMSGFDAAAVQVDASAFTAAGGSSNHG